MRDETFEWEIWTEAEWAVVVPPEEEENSERKE